MSNTSMLSVSSRIRRLFCFFTVTLALATLGMFAPRSADALSFTSLTVDGIVYNAEATFAGDQSWNFQLEIITTGWTGDPLNQMHAFGFKFEDPKIGDVSDLTNRMLTNANITFWTAFDGQTSARTTDPSGDQLGKGKGWVTEVCTSCGGLGLGLGSNGNAFTYSTTIADLGDVNALGVGSVLNLKSIIVSSNPGEFVTQMSASVVPLPSTFFLFGAGFAGFVAWRVREERRRNHRISL